MSNYYTPHCLDCEVDMLEDGCNHGDDKLLAVIHNVTAVIHLIGEGVEVSVHGEQINGLWLHDHKCHRVVVMSEYKDHYFKRNGQRVTVRVLGKD